MCDDKVDKARALEVAETEYLFSSVEALQNVPGNPYKAATFDNGVQKSFLVAANPSPMNSRICGIDLNDPVLPDDVLAQFAKVGATVCIPVIGSPAEVGARSKALGAAPLRGWTHGQFAADIDGLPDIPATQQTRRLRPQDMGDFVKIHAEAFRSTKNGYDMALDMFNGLLETGRAEAYAVDIDGMPVAIGLVYFAENNIGYLATAATLKAGRKQGAHAALISRRIAAAYERGSRRVFATALLNSQSRRNLQAAGLSLSHVQTLITI